MGVYIKGMEMPDSCWNCEVGGAKQMDNATCPFYSMEYWEQENYQDKIADGCPLVPVSPHGRLIDADALCKTLRSLAENEYTPEVFANWIENHIDSIIPAEEGEA